MTDQNAPKKFARGDEGQALQLDVFDFISDAGEFDFRVRKGDGYWTIHGQDESLIGKVERVEEGRVHYFKGYEYSGYAVAFDALTHVDMSFMPVAKFLVALH